MVGPLWKMLDQTKMEAGLGVEVAVMKYAGICIYFRPPGVAHRLDVHFIEKYSVSQCSEAEALSRAEGGRSLVFFFTKFFPFALSLHFPPNCSLASSLAHLHFFS